MGKVTLTERTEAAERLRGFLSGDRPELLCVLRHVSRSGMSRDISLFVVDADGELVNVTFYAAQVLGETPRDRDGQRVIRVNGCGMDMGFHLVYSVSSILFAERERAGYVVRHRWI